MIGKTYFESLKDVERHFASRDELASIPVPPADLWDRLDSARGNAQRRDSALAWVLPPCPPQSLEISHDTPARRYKFYALNPVERLQAAFPARRRSKARHSRPAPMSWKDLL